MDGSQSTPTRGGKTVAGGSPRFLLAAVLLAGLVILGAGAFLGLALQISPRGVAGSVLGSAIGGPFHLVDQNGKKVTNTDLKGKWLLVYFGYTHCPDACPTALNDIALALDELGPKRGEVRPVFITVDPERDTPQALKDYVASFDAPILALTGTPGRGRPGGQELPRLLRQAPRARRRLFDGPQLGHLCDGPEGPVHRQLHPPEHARGDRRTAEEAVGVTSRWQNRRHRPYDDGDYPSAAACGAATFSSPALSRLASSTCSRKPGSVASPNRAIRSS